METRTTRLPVDLLDAAEAEGRDEQRSMAKQAEHWARFGMFFACQTSTARRRIERAIVGTPAGELPGDERVVANAAISASISTAANEMSFADRLAVRGVTTVVMDEDGRMVKRYPDGTTTAL